MTAHQIEIAQKVGIWIWQGANISAYIALNIASVLENINEVVKIIGGLVIIGSGATAWYFTIKKNNKSSIRKMKKKTRK